jgi:hypothetical protein
LPTVRRLAPVLVAAGLTLAACGSSSNTSTDADRAAKVDITSAYEEFFSSQTSLSDRVGLLQNGPKFKAVVKSFASNPLAKNVSATVSSVSLQGADKAKVVYVVKLGSAALPKQTGSAVKQNGTWKVGYASLCKLIALQGSTPSACKS